MIVRRRAPVQIGARERLAAALLLPVLGCLALGCQEPEAAVNAPTGIAAYPQDASFGDAWYQGQAELTSYNLDQLRYGEERRGKAVLIFVTEDFSRSKLVKLDEQGGEDADRVTVLKLNRIKEFTTGIYTYSLMSSVFTPISGNQDPHTLKVTMSSQDWCGQSFTQFEWQDTGYRVKAFSYFESRSDVELDLAPAILEDELWTKIRINPAAMPVGEIQITPATQHLRLSHDNYAVQSATASLDAAGESESVYEVSYADGRVVKIWFETASPHAITAWEDSELVQGERVVTARATRDQSLWIDYWTRNALEDEALRAALNLDQQGILP